MPLILSQDVGACDDLVEEEKNGYIVDPMNALQAAKCMEKILSDRNLAQAMGEHSSKIVQDWTYDRCVQGFSDMLNYVSSSAIKRKK